MTIKVKGNLKIQNPDTILARNVNLFFNNSYRYGIAVGAAVYNDNHNHNSIITVSYNIVIIIIIEI